MKILRIDASARGTGSRTRALIDALLAELHDVSGIVHRDLSEPLPQVDSVWIEANETAAKDRTVEQRAKLALSDTLVAELNAADLIVIGLPVYNFGVPASLKAWIDQVCRARLTFEYHEAGPVGLLSGKRAIVVYASGGVPFGHETDFASGYMRHVLGFVGISDVRIVAADGHLADPDAVPRALTELARIGADLGKVAEA